MSIIVGAFCCLLCKLKVLTKKQIEDDISHYNPIIKATFQFSTRFLHLKFFHIYCITISHTFILRYCEVIIYFLVQRDKLPSKSTVSLPCTYLLVPETSLYNTRTLTMALGPKPYQQSRQLGRFVGHH
jgi:hypothetical protein